MTNYPYPNMNQPGAQPPWGGQPQQNYPQQGYPQQGQPQQGYSQQPQGYLPPQQQGYSQQPQGYLPPQQQGYSQPYGTPGYTQPPQPPGGGESRMVLVVLICVLVVALGLGAWWLITKNSNSTASPTSPPTATSSTPAATSSTPTATSSTPTATSSAPKTTGPATAPEFPKKFGDFNYSKTSQEVSFYDSSDSTQIMVFTDSPNKFESVRSKLKDPAEVGDFTCGPQEISLKNNKKTTVMTCITDKKYDRLLVMGTTKALSPQQLGDNGMKFLEEWK